MERARLTKTFLLLLITIFCLPAWGQEATNISGRVVDDAGEPMIGVSIVEKGTTNATVTDLDGNFKLAVQRGATLVVSYVGYTTQEVRAAQGMKIILKENARVFDEVVVVGYGIQKKSSVTGAISQVKAEDMENRTITNAKQALQGKTAGVQLVSASASPGSSPTVRIRGFSSNVGSDPLYVVDGVRMTDIGGIDPNDIASMEILKDAASAAIYGAEAGNGVVLITTKKGKAGEGRISYSFQYVGQSLAKLPKLLNASEYTQYMREGNTFTQEFINANWDRTTDTDWLDVAFENSKMTKHNLAFTGGGERGNYYLSLSYLDNDGIVKGDADTYQRLTATVNSEYKIKDWLKVGTTNQIEKYNLRQVSTNNEYGSLLTAVMMMDPLTPNVYTGTLPFHVQNALSMHKHLLTDADGHYYGISPFYLGEQYHPMIMRDNTVGKTSGFTVNGSIYADFTPLRGFTFTSRLGYRLSGTRQSNTQLPFYGNGVQSRDYVSHNAQSNTAIYYQWENFANYMRSFGRHNVNGMVGMSYQETTTDFVRGELNAKGENALLKNDPLFFFLKYGSPSATKAVDGEKLRSARLSYFGRLSYDYANRYYAQFSLRADAADLALLPHNTRWGYFPAASIGWTISEESFFAPLRNTINSLKLRASWGQNGSLSALGNYSYSTTMEQNGLYPFLTGNVYVRGANPTALGNDDLKWETSEQADLGIDAYALDSRLNFSVDYFNKKTKDLLIWKTTPSLSIGGETSPINAGNVSNKGFELELGWRDNIKGFSYGIRANLATISNKVTYIDPSISRLPGSTFHTYTVTYFEKDYPVYYFRGYKFAGIDAASGNPTFEDLDNSGEVNDGDLTYIGDAIPDFTYGITLTAAYRGFDLTVFGTGSQGNDIFNCINRPDYAASNKQKELFFDDRWTPTHTNATQPRAGATNMDKYATSSAMVFDGSYFKIKQIQLGYTLPKQWTSKLFINNARIYLSMDDFFTFTKYKGFDPEASANATSGMGIDKGAYPNSKKLVIGFNIDF